MQMAFPFLLLPIYDMPPPIVHTLWMLLVENARAALQNIAEPNVPVVIL